MVISGGKPKKTGEKPDAFDDLLGLWSNSRMVISGGKPKKKTEKSQTYLMTC
jgi:hypothetical protein